MEYPSIDIVDVDIEDWDKTREVVESLGHFDALVNNAAVAVCEPFLDCSPSDFDKYAKQLFILLQYMFRHDLNSDKKALMLYRSISAKYLHNWVTKHKYIFNCITQVAKLYLYNMFFFFRMFNINVKAVLNISQVVARKMVENKTHGAIVNISSQASKVLSIHWNALLYLPTIGGAYTCNSYLDKYLVIRM